MRRFDEGRLRNMMLFLIWVLPFMGAFAAFIYMPRTARRVAFVVDDLPPEFQRDPPPEKLVLPGLPGIAIESLFYPASAFPQLSGPALAAWLAQALDPRPRLNAGRQATRAWLLHLRAALGEHFTLYETEQAWVLSSLEPHLVIATAEFIASARRRITRVLEGIARLDAEEKSILVIFDDDDSYYDYVSAYYPDEGEFAFSGGMFLGSDQPHFVVKKDDLSLIEPVIAHELTHSALLYLPLPRWLNEGLAVNTEQRLMGVPRSSYTASELRAMHDEFWSEQTIQEFWSGTSFLRADQANFLSYELARIMVEQMGRDWPSFVQFVQEAEHADAGAKAAATYLGLDLGSYACALLARSPAPDWQPDPDAWSSA